MHKHKLNQHIYDKKAGRNVQKRLTFTFNTVLVWYKSSKVINSPPKHKTLYLWGYTIHINMNQKLYKNNL